jgi:Short C-terminal domain
MNLADELKKLDDLRWRGTLTDDEFQRAKERLLSEAPAPAPVATPRDVEEADDELTRLDRAWGAERQQHVTIGRNGQPIDPDGINPLVPMVFVGVFGVFWTAMAISITSGAPDFGPFAIAKVMFPLFGCAFIAFAVYTGIKGQKKVNEYKAAKSRYLEKRRKLLEKTGETPPD